MACVKHNSSFICLKVIASNWLQALLSHAKQVLPLSKRYWCKNSKTLIYHGKTRDFFLVSPFMGGLSSWFHWFESMIAQM